MMKKINLKYLLIAICAIQLIAILFLLDYSLEKEIVYVPGKTKTITLPAGNQAVYSVNQKKYNDKPTKEIKKIIKEIPDLKSSKVIALTETNSQLQLKLGQKDLVINDKENEIKQWKDKYNEVTTNKDSVKVISEVSPKIITVEQREKFFSPKQQYIIVTSDNPSIKFFGNDSYVYKNPEKKNFLEITIDGNVSKYINDFGYQSTINLEFNPDGRLRLYIFGGISSNNFNVPKSFYGLGTQLLILKF